DRVWPDFITLSSQQSPFLRLAPLEAQKTIVLEGLRITPLPVNHVVPTLGFLIEDDASAVLLVSDTGPSDAIWQRANTVPNLKAVFLEATFPNALGPLASVSKHLTPALFAAEVRKLRGKPRIIAVHIKARYRDQVIRELQALGIANLEIGKPATIYTF
ncbi:MAG TPA: MBL fold metallo-hydrolase, partial [Gemmataceae bacterium]|nr:MBL fold metallo-hydrolase [Gemmataceae bacterium]